MSTIDPAKILAEPWDTAAASSRVLAQRVPAPIVPRGSIAGRSLAAVVAILTFLAALTTGAAMMLVGSANDWQSAVGREVTIQVRPMPGRDIEADVNAAAALARSAAGIADVRVYSKKESESLVEPWLGSGLALGELPIPRMIVLRLASGIAPDFAGLRAALGAQVPSAGLDDHRGWIDRMRAMADAAVVIGIGILALVVAVTVLTVTFATRGAMATNRPIVEVLHYVGATDSFIARQFQRHFLLLGLKGGAIGGGAALALFAVVAAVNAWIAGTPAGEEASALFGGLALGAAGYFAILALIALMAAVAAVTSRQTVNRTLEGIE